MRTRNVISFMLIALLSASLTGCFRSDTALIGADDADTPFNTLTYVRVGDDDKITLKRDGDRYVNPDEKDKAFVRMKALGGNLFVAQITDVKDGKSFHLYGYIRMAPDKTRFELIKGVARPHDLSAIDKGWAGLGRCPHDAKVVCVATLKGFIDYAASTIQAEYVEHFNILAIK